jgi:hypothetical protein
MVLGQVIAIKTKLFIEFDQPQALGVLLAHGHAVGVDVVEDAEAHYLSFPPGHGDGM